jgi:hypothetical protein
MSQQKNLSDQFEDELDDFFKDRALERAQVFADKSKVKSSKERDEEENNEKPFSSDVGSGCCMTGCHDCPWGYRL